jgi:hypothetical protein
VHEIIDAVALQPRSQQQGLQGDASLALLLAHCSHPAAYHKLDLALSAAATAPLSLSLFSGVSGLLWLLHRVGAGAEADPLIAHLDTAVLDRLSVPHWRERYDLVSGLVGAGVAAAHGGTSGSQTACCRCWKRWLSSTNAAQPGPHSRRASAPSAASSFHLE